MNYKYKSIIAIFDLYFTIGCQILPFLSNMGLDQNEKGSTFLLTFLLPLSDLNG